MIPASNLVVWKKNENDNFYYKIKDNLSFCWQQPVNKISLKEHN